MKISDELSLQALEERVPTVYCVSQIIDLSVTSNYIQASTSPLKIEKAENSIAICFHW